MTSTDTLLRRLDDPALSSNEQARLRCQIAADLEHRGQYEAARDVLAELWRGVGQRPALEGLSELLAAEVLLRAGALSGWLGSIRQLEGAQDAAKDLISESIARFQALGERVRAAAAQSELGLCYKRAGAYDEARVVYHEALEGLADEPEVNDTEKELQAEILNRLAVVAACSGCFNEALRILTEAAPLFEGIGNDTLKGKFHNDRAGVLTCLSKAEHRPDYTDRAIIEYTAASHHFELAGHTSYRARAENNLGYLLYTISHYAEAREHLNRARQLFVGERDKGSVAQVDETRARVLLAEGRVEEAGRVIRDAVRTLEKGGEQALLAEALTTQGRVLAKLGNIAESQATLRRAADLAEQAGAVEDAGRALLSLLEEHADRMAERDLLQAYRRADELLRETQDAETVARLRGCAGRILSARLSLNLANRPHSRADFWANFHLYERVHEFEARYIRRALIDARGSVTRAARLLGLDHHTKLASLLAGRHKELAHLRTPPEVRRKSLIDPAGPRRWPARPRPVRILHIEDNKFVADAVRDTLVHMGWAVVTCADGAEAARVLEGTEPFDLVIFDNELPGRSGVELMRLGRSLAHRKRLPFVMFSASDVEREAWGAGADAFLRKPEDVGKLAATVTRLLSKGAG